MHMHLGSVPTIVVSSADAAREIMKTNDLIFANRPETSLGRKLLYDSKDVSVAPYGEHWRQLKSIMVLQLLSNKRVQSFQAVRDEEIALAVKKIMESSLSNKAVDLSNLFVTVTNDVVCMATFGKKYSEGKRGEIFLKLLRDFLVVLGGFTFQDFIPALAWVDRVRGHDANVDRIAKELDEFLEEVVEERLEKLMKETRVDEHKENFVDILLKIQKEGSSGISLDRNSIKAVLLDAYAAGTDTTSTVLDWAMTELVRHPSEMKKVQDEIRGILNGRQHITDDDLEKMHYLKAAIKETLRIHTPIPLLVPRVASQDVKVMGYDIAKGTMVITNAWAIGRDPKLWDRPQEFRPERFLYSRIDFKGHDFELIPFGAGRRGCPGIAFAMATNEFVLANLLQNFNWELPNGEKGEDLDMTEAPGVAVRRRTPLLAVATPFSG